ncbi:serine/threonine protein kinase [Rubinisphaera italica]|uniref:serine/threonine protein kinase n=1 Tax=Rubinisphaera italica TaxID=2527969 RepID=UPI0013EEFA6D|nr:serine/threonine-protein kinase [Rubinisphaera italica]
MSEAIRDSKNSGREYDFRPYIKEFGKELNKFQESIEQEYLSEIEPHLSSFETHNSQSNANEFNVDWSRYKLVRLIGTGSHAKVYFATDFETGEHVAVKFLRKQFQQNAARIEAFINEAQILKNFHHENVINIRGLGQIPSGGLFIVLDWISGRSLHEQLESQEFVSEFQIRKWIHQVCMGLQHIHSRGIIHCDLKPANILLNVENQILITDFGFAKYLNDDFRQARNIQGTVSFMAPEQIDQLWGRICPATDIYAVGVILYLFLTRRLPFISETFEEIALAKLSSEPITDPRELNSTISESIASICMKCLQSEPTFRFESAAQLINAIDPISYNSN